MQNDAVRKYVTMIVSLPQYGSGVLWWVWRACQPCLQYAHHMCLSVCMLISGTTRPNFT